MKFKKRPLVLLVTLVLVFAMGLYGCTQTPGVVPTPPSPTPTITKIDITNAETTLDAGSLPITAKCTPDGIADTDFTVKLDTKTFGVTLDGKTLKVNPGAVSGGTVSVTVTSTADSSKSASKSFTVNVDESKITYVEVSTGDELFASFGTTATAASMAKNYKLTADIELSKGNDKGESVLTAWAPSDLPFTGLLNGNGYKIQGFNMPQATETIGGGFFKENQGVIKNIGFDNSNYQSHWMNLGANSGVVAGINKGGILNVYTNVPIASASGAVGAIVGSNSGFLLNSYAKGVAYSNDTTGAKAGVVAINSGSVAGTVADMAATELDCFVGDIAGQGNVDLNKQLLTPSKMQTTATYTTMGWDNKAWHFANVYPILINADFDATEIEQELEIITPRIVEVGDYADKALQISVKTTNAANEEIIYSDDAAVENEELGIKVSATGAVTFAGVSKVEGTVGKFDGKTLIINAALKSDPEISNIAYLTLRDDGYNSTKGIVVTTEQQLYDTFYKTVDGIVNRDLSTWSKRAMSRTIKLGGHIVLSAPAKKPDGGTAAGLWSGSPNANWRGVGKSNKDGDGEAFIGIFDGQGYSISGLNVKISGGAGETVFDTDHPYAGAERYDSNAAWGFFRTIGTTTGIPGIVRNLVMKDGVIDCTLFRIDGDRKQVGGIAQFFNAGLIENCIVDLKISTTANLAGMVVGNMQGTVKANRARLEGSTRISNTLAMGELTSSLPAGDGLFKPWEPNAVGAFVAYPSDSKSGSEFINSYAMGEKDDRKDFSCRSDFSFAESNVKFVNSGFISVNDFQIAQTFIDKGFDPAVFSFKDNCYPTLKNATFNPDTDQVEVPSIIKITKGAAIYDYLAVKDSGITIATTTTNDKGMAAKFSIEGTGATINATTGAVTFTDEIVDSLAIKVKVTLGEGGDNIRGDEYSFVVNKDGYDPAKGIEVSNETELHNVFFKSDDATHGITGAEWLKRAYSRKIVLTQDIVLSTHANWPRITTTFKGTLSGNGHTISGLNVVNAVELNNSGYGFFDTIQGAPGQVVVEKLTLKGSISYQVKDWSGNGNAGLNGVAALVRELANGTIQDVIVDVDIATNAEMNGKFAAYMKNDSKLVNCLAFGTMGNIDGVSNDTYARKNWANYSFGALAGKLDGNSALISSFAQGAEDKTQNGAQFNEAGDIAWKLGLASRNGVHDDTGKSNTSGFKLAEEMNSAEAFDGYDVAIWTFEAGKQPTLKKVIA